MKFAISDFKKLRWQLAVATSLLVASGAIAYLSVIATRKAEAEYRAAADRHARTDTKLRQVRTEEEEIKNRGALFLRMQERNIVGEEKRLDWTELLQDIKRRLRLPDMSYEFAPQKPLEGGSNDGYAFFVSPMKLHLRLMHEEDLLNFLDGVQSEAKAIVLTRSCNVARSASSGAGQLAADCELSWITVHAGGNGR